MFFNQYGDTLNLTNEEINNLYLAFKNDVVLFAKTFLSHIATEIPEFHKELYAILQKRYRYNAFVLFRGAAKTTLSRHICGLHNVLFAKEPVQLWISGSIDQAKRDLIGIQDEIMQNDVLNQWFPAMKGSKWNLEEAEFANGCYVSVKGYGSRIRGIKWKNQRPTLINLDDFESEANTGTPNQRQDVDNWIDDQVLPAGDKNPTFQFFGTIVHPEAFLAKAKNLTIFQPPNGIYFERAIEHRNKPTWNRYDMDWIRERREYYESKNKLSSFMQEYYNIPRLLGSCYFDVKQVMPMEGKYQRYEHISYLEYSSGKKELLFTYIGVDPARSTSEGADNTVMLVVGVNKSKQHVVLDVIAEKVSPSQQVKLLFDLADKYRPIHVGRPSTIVSGLRCRVHHSTNEQFNGRKTLHDC